MTIGNAPFKNRHDPQETIDMAESGKADKGRKETQKKPAMTLKEKRKAKADKKDKKY